MIYSSFDEKSLRNDNDIQLLQRDNPSMILKDSKDHNIVASKHGHHCLQRSSAVDTRNKLVKYDIRNDVESALAVVFNQVAPFPCTLQEKKLLTLRRRKLIF